MRILGVDPGTHATGWGVVEAAGGALRWVAHGVVRTKSADPLWVRLGGIHEALTSVLDDHAPDVLALERVYVSKNVESALKLGHARGAIMVACTRKGLAVAEYTASQVKSAVAGTGRAEKNQVQEMVRILLRLAAVPPQDAADALAIALCHERVGRSPLRAPLAGAGPR